MKRKPRSGVEKANSVSPILQLLGSAARQVEGAVNEGHLNFLKTGVTSKSDILGHLEKLKMTAIKGNEAAFHELFCWAYYATCSLNTLPPEILVSLSKQISVWPMLNALQKSVVDENLNHLKSIRLGEECKGFDAKRMFHTPTIFNRYMRGMMHVIFEVKEGIAYDIPEDLRTQILRLPEFNFDSVDSYLDACKSLLELTLGHPCSQDPDLRRQVEHLSTRKGDKEGSKAAESLLNSDLHKRFKEALLLMLPPKKTTKSKG
jgi:hypothetical protein